MLTDIDLKLFTLNKLKGIGPVTLKKLSTTSGFLEASPSELAILNPKLQKALSIPGAWDEAQELAEADIVAAQKSDTQIISVLDDRYPALLKATFDAPFFLYVRGQWSPTPLKSMAVIGTRESTGHGVTLATRISSYLAANGWSIVSGLAIGCDALAHEGALSVNGHTVAVLAHGLHIIAPKQNQKLAEKILDKGGALVSEYGFGIEPHASYFVKRDRIQAALSKAVVMIQSEKAGGSMHATKAVIEYGRVLAIPRPTERDLANREKKIEVNQILCDGTPEEKAQLLDCTISDLDQLFVINGKDDYDPLAKRLENTSDLFTS
jgi:DNA processing protein